MSNAIHVRPKSETVDMQSAFWRDFSFEVTGSDGTHETRFATCEEVQVVGSSMCDGAVSVRFRGQDTWRRHVDAGAIRREIDHGDISRRGVLLGFFSFDIEGE